MNKDISILGIAGSLRRQSYNRSVLRAAAQLVPDSVTLDNYELDGIPGFNQDEEQNPPTVVVESKKRIRAADAILFVTPEYNYSVPGVLKNAIDWASRPYGDSAWFGKPAAISQSRGLEHLHGASPANLACHFRIMRTNAIPDRVVFAVVVDLKPSID